MKIQILKYIHGCPGTPQARQPSNNQSRPRRFSEPPPPPPGGDDPPPDGDEPPPDPAIPTLDPPPIGQIQAHPPLFEEADLPNRNATTTPPASGDGHYAPEPPDTPKSTTNPPNQNMPPTDPASPLSELPIQGSLASGSSSAAHPGSVLVSLDEVSLVSTEDLFGAHSPIGRPILPSIVHDLQQFFTPNSHNQPHPCKQSALSSSDP